MIKVNIQSPSQIRFNDIHDYIFPWATEKIAAHVFCKSNFNQHVICTGTAHKDPTLY